MDIGIVGAGLAGLSAAIKLASNGHKVAVYDAAMQVGGKLSQKTIQGYRFDLGPSLFTMPHWIDELYHEAGKNPRAYYSYKKLETITHYFYEDGTQFSSRADTGTFERELQQLGIDSGNLSAYLTKAAFLYNTTEKIFLKSSLHRWKSYLNLSVAKSLFRLPFIKGGTTLHHMNAAYFKDPRLQQYFDRMATYNGSNPYQAPGTLGLISHIEHNVGAYYPKGGMYSIAAGLYQLALDLGVKFHLGTKVDKIVIATEANGRKRATALVVEAKQVAYDAVISNMDVYYTYNKLLPAEKAPTKMLNQEKSSSALIFYWGVKGTFKQLGLHNIFFAQDYKAEFNDIFKNKIPHHDPTVYLNCTCKETPTDAPPNCENWFVMINVPHDSGQDWQQIKKEARQQILKKLNRMLHVDLDSLIEVEDCLDPIGIEQRTSSYKGALYGNASNNKMAAFLRHANFSSKIKDLYFCGGSVHPGGGIPLAIQSGKIVADLVA